MIRRKSLRIWFFFCSKTDRKKRPFTKNRVERSAGGSNARLYVAITLPLGVFFGTIPVEQDNWQARINKLEKSLNLWKSRSLSFIGKSLIINVFFYLAKVLIPLPWVLSRGNQLVWPFLWGSKIETVSRNTCYLPHSSGGLHVSNFED